jgi:hypothetical protein
VSQLAEMRVEVSGDARRHGDQRNTRGNASSSAARSLSSL